MANINLPKGRAAKIAFLKKLQAGAASLSDLLEKVYTVGMWKQCPDDKDYLISFDGLHRIAKVDYENQVKPGDYNITLNLY